MSSKINFRTSIVLVVLFIYIGWSVYEQGGWSILVTVKVINILCLTAVISLLGLLQRSLFKHGFELAFPFIIISLLSGFVLGVSDSKFILPFDVDLLRWQESINGEVLSWLLSSLIYFPFMFALNKPNKPLKQDK